VIQFKVDDIYKADVIAKELEQAAGPGFMASSWMEQNKAIFHALRLERLVTFITIGLIVLVAALNILISLIMMVMEKDQGHRRASVHGLSQIANPPPVHTQGVLIGMIGTASDSFSGIRSPTPAHVTTSSRWRPRFYSIDYVPFAPRLIDGILVALVAMGISFVATIYPSWSAARILPAEALRYE